MKKNELVVKVIRIMGTETATLARVESVKKGVVKLVGVESLTYRADDGSEINPVIPGCSSHLIPLDGGEQEAIESGSLPEKV